MNLPFDFRQRAAASIEASIATKRALLNDADLVSTIAKSAEVIVAAFKAGNKLVLFGNGGSAADAQHIAAEFVGRFAFNRPALPAMALSVNTSAVTAIGNDYGFDHVFSRQLEAFARPGDVAIGISTSGNSPNVLAGLAAARRLGLHTLGWTGCTGGSMKEAADFCICAPSNETPRIQECHILIGHIVAEIAEQEIFGEQGGISRS